MLFWFVDKIPRSRKPIQFGRYSDVCHPDPVIVPHSIDFPATPIWVKSNPNVCSQDLAKSFVTANFVGKKLLNNRSSSLEKRYPRRTERSPELGRTPSRSWSSGRRRDENYDDFLILCKKIEKMMTKSMEDLNKRTTKKDSFTDTKNKFKRFPSERQSQGHYVWMQPDLQRYRSRFNPMKVHDLIRDDMAVRRWRPELKNLVEQSRKSQQDFRMTGSLPPSRMMVVVPHPNPWDPKSTGHKLVVRPHSR